MYVRLHPAWREACAVLRAACIASHAAAEELLAEEVEVGGLMALRMGAMETAEPTSASDARALARLHSDDTSSLALGASITPCASPGQAVAAPPGAGAGEPSSHPCPVAGWGAGAPVKAAAAVAVPAAGPAQPSPATALSHECLHATSLPPAGPSSAYDGMPQAASGSLLQVCMQHVGAAAERAVCMHNTHSSDCRTVAVIPWHGMPMGP